MLLQLVLALLFCIGQTVRGQVSDEKFDMKRVKKISLIDENRQSLSLAKKLNRALSLFVFISPECPLCKNYTRVLNALTKEFADSLDVIGIVSGKTYSGKEINSFRKKYAVGFKVLIDPAMQLTHYFKATITPEVVLLNQKSELIYRGAIDDWVVELGKTKARPSQEYLRQALTQYINHQPVSVKKTKPKGCYINEY